MDPNQPTNPQDATTRDRVSGPTASGQNLRDLRRDFNFGGQFRAGVDGLVVRTVTEDGFFHNAGVLEGDQIISVNGQDVTSEAEFRRLMMAGEGRFAVIVMRNGERQEIFVNAADINATGTTSRGRVGGTAESSADGNRAALGLWFYHTRRGAHVTRVVPGSPAERAGVQIGDFILRINDVPYRDWQAASSQVAAAEPQSMLTLQVWRDGRVFPVEAQLGAYYDVYSDPNETWDNVAPREPERSNGAAGERVDSRDLEQRVRQLERELAELRQRVDNTRTNSTAPRPESNNGQRTSAPPDGQ